MPRGGSSTRRSPAAPEVESHRRGEAAEDLRVRQRLAERRDRAAVVHQVEVAVRLVHVVVLELRRRGQQHVGVVGGVGLEVLEDDGEEIVAAQSGSTRSRSGAIDAGFEL
jgi:hypothetical protein